MKMEKNDDNKRLRNYEMYIFVESKHLTGHKYSVRRMIILKVIHTATFEI